MVRLGVLMILEELYLNTRFHTFSRREDETSVFGTKLEEGIFSFFDNREGYYYDDKNLRFKMFSVHMEEYNDFTLYYLDQCIIRFYHDTY